MEKLTISVREAAKIVGISATKLYELARSDGFPAFTVGKRILVSTKGLASWIDAQASTGCQS